MTDAPNPTEPPKRHPTELDVPEGEIVLMNEAGRAAVDALYVLFQRDRLGSMCAFLSIMQMALSRSKLSGEDGEQDQPQPPVAVH